MQKNGQALGACPFFYAVTLLENANGGSDPWIGAAAASVDAFSAQSSKGLRIGVCGP